MFFSRCYWEKQLLGVIISNLMGWVRVYEGACIQGEGSKILNILYFGNEHNLNAIPFRTVKEEEIPT